MSLRSFSTSTAALAAKKASTMTKYFGRPSNNLLLGLVGLANVGKSTFFQAITKSTLGNPANYPFATIEPEKSLIVVELPKLDHYAQLFGSEKKLPSTLTIYDIAGLTRNASSGEGMGNKFLADIRQVDGLFQMVRGFRNDEIIHIENDVNPVRDMEVVNDELILKDLEYVETGLELATKSLKKPNVNRAVVDFELATLNRVLDTLYEGKKVISETWSEEEIELINSYNLLTAKPTVYLLNVSESDYLQGQNEFLEQVQAWMGQHCKDDKLVMVSVELESKLQELGDAERASAIPTIVDEMRSALHLVSFYTCGPKEARQWTVREGTTAPEGAGVIHTDLQKTFISAQVYKWQDLEREKAPLNEAGLKAAGKQHRCGKKYELEDGDVMVVKAAGGRTR
ncbi:uncharacterized protein CANTADRAFT_43703 [Suhomyces tanzawaensis NRRL Y-17324]|uniref:Obg-like ATPase homolog n=1 Tax=Suhomyces tanzawaensis NRRL Y-17324 TaxID=984487 RepID=A0A1E4SRD4_9ASCO|nr:uncharacterized protein CANTADRAFT_43703 [Suhomyces tanzawaensis NRRL Y-17324]ODV82058.1 hypothetical protein CANTADRAFT_43703 [Suhomyces tanzawaensis NRRL Y-17324]